MKCQLCKTEAYIKSSKYVVEGDDAANEETKLYIEQEMVCRNQNCKNFGQVIHTFKNPIKIG